MDITQLRYFLAAAETLNYTRAAKKLYISRQALRQALAAMETELHVPLFINRHNKLSLTAAGEYLQTAGQEVVGAFDQMMEGAGGFARQKNTIKVALSVSLFPFLLPETEGLLKRFKAKHPALALELSHIPNDEALQAVQTGKADCALAIWMPRPIPGVAREVLLRYGVLISYCLEQYPDWEGRPVLPEDLAGHRCIGFGTPAESLLPLFEKCRQKGVILDYEMVAQTIDAFYKISHEGVVGLNVDAGNQALYGNVSSSPLEGFIWEIGLLLREDSPRSGQAHTFCRFITREYRQMWEEHGRSGMPPLTTE